VASSRLWDWCWHESGSAPCFRVSLEGICAASGRKRRLRTECRTERGDDMVSLEVIATQTSSNDRLGKSDGTEGGGTKLVKWMTWTTSRVFISVLPAWILEHGCSPHQIVADGGEGRRAVGNGGSRCGRLSVVGPFPMKKMLEKRKPVKGSMVTSASGAKPCKRGLGCRGRGRESGRERAFRKFWVGKGSPLLGTGKGASLKSNCL